MKLSRFDFKWNNLRCLHRVSLSTITYYEVGKNEIITKKRKPNKKKNVNQKYRNKSELAMLVHTIMSIMLFS